MPRWARRTLNNHRRMTARSANGSTSSGGGQEGLGAAPPVGWEPGCGFAPGGCSFEGAPARDRVSDFSKALRKLGQSELDVVAALTLQ